MLVTLLILGTVAYATFSVLVIEYGPQLLIKLGEINDARDARAEKIRAETEELRQWNTRAKQLLDQLEAATDHAERARIKAEIDRHLARAKKSPEDTRARADAAWARAFAERTGGTVPTNKALGK